MELFNYSKVDPIMRTTQFAYDSDRHSCQSPSGSRILGALDISEFNRRLQDAFESESSRVEVSQSGNNSPSLSFMAKTLS